MTPNPSSQLDRTNCVRVNRLVELQWPEPHLSSRGAPRLTLIAQWPTLTLIALLAEPNLIILRGPDSNHSSLCCSRPPSSPRRILSLIDRSRRRRSPSAASPSPRPLPPSPPTLHRITGPICVAAARSTGTKKDGQTVVLGAAGRRHERQGDVRRKAWWWPDKDAAAGDHLSDLLPTPATSLDGWTCCSRHHPPLRAAGAASQNTWTGRTRRRAKPRSTAWHWLTCGSTLLRAASTASLCSSASLATSYLSAIQLYTSTCLTISRRSTGSETDSWSGVGY